VLLSKVGFGATSHQKLELFFPWTDKLQMVHSRPRTYPFFEDIYPILYHGQKSDIISYPISRQKNEKGYVSYILSNFIFAKVYLLILETFVGSFFSSCLACLTATVRLKNNNSLEPVQCVIQKRTPHNKRKQKLHCAKEKNVEKFKFVLKKGYRIG
jgi:hypothetical protein